MFCPNCKAEYVQGFTQCADCHIALVAELSTEEESSFSTSYIEWVPLITTNYQGDIALVKSILESESISYWVQGEFRGFSTGAVFHVDKNRLQDARELLQDLKLNPVGYSTRKDSGLF